jgi:hypothetical protein
VPQPCLQAEDADADSLGDVPKVGGLEAGFIKAMQCLEAKGCRAVADEHQDENRDGGCGRATPGCSGTSCECEKTNFETRISRLRFKG